MSGKITDLSAIGSIDPTADLLEIVDISANASYSVTPNNLVGISGGVVVSTTDSQTLSNKVLGNSNTITVKAANLTLQDGADTSKQVNFVLSGITAANTRSLTVPDASGTLVLTAATQTLTNKTLTSPAITGGTMDNTTVTIDALNGHTTPTIVTVAGLQINNGIVGANGVNTASILDANVTPAKLVAGTGSGWAWGSWSPSWTNLTVGNATVASSYIQTGKLVNFRLSLTFGSTTSVTGSAVKFSVPVATNAAYNQSMLLGFGGIDNVGTQAYIGVLVWIDANTVEIRPADPSSYVNFGVTRITSTIPFTFTTGSRITANGCYEAA